MRFKTKVTVDFDYQQRAICNPASENASHIFALKISARPRLKNMNKVFFLQK